MTAVSPPAQLIGRVMNVRGSATATARTACAHPDDLAEECGQPRPRGGDSVRLVMCSMIGVPSSPSWAGREPSFTSSMGMLQGVDTDQGDTGADQGTDGVAAQVGPPSGNSLVPQCRDQPVSTSVATRRAGSRPARRRDVGVRSRVDDNDLAPPPGGSEEGLRCRRRTRWSGRARRCAGGGDHEAAEVKGDTPRQAVGRLRTASASVRRLVLQVGLPVVHQLAAADTEHVDGLVRPAGAGAVGEC